MASFWKACIEEGLKSLGGEADMVDVYKWAESVDWLGKRDLEDSPHQGRPRYTHSLRTCASRMVRRGELIRVRDGRFRLPKSGRYGSLQE